jgi:hypothetical protein
MEKVVQHRNRPTPLHHTRCYTLPTIAGPESMAMNRRRFAVAAISFTVLLAGCDTVQKPSSTATLLNNSGIQEALKSLAAAIDDLVSDISEFDTENWREVVPKVTSSAEDVSGRFETLRRSLSVPNV